MPKRASCLALRQGGALVAVILGLGLGGTTDERSYGFTNSVVESVGSALPIPAQDVGSLVRGLRSAQLPPPARVRQGGGRAGAEGQGAARSTGDSSDGDSLAAGVRGGLEQSTDSGAHRAPAQDPAALVCAAYTTWNCSDALAVARCESELDPGGNLFQIDYEAHKDKTESREALLDPAENIRVAHDIWLDQGWWAWRWSAGCHGLVPGSFPVTGINE